MNKERLLILNIHRDCRGSLCALQKDHNIDFDLKRIFVVSADSGEIRGNHAHIRCSQFLICLSGSILVTCDDGKRQTDYELYDNNVGLFIPPRIWSKQRYLKDSSLLLVACDRIYEPNDYISDRPQFLSHVNTDAST